jgi:hypothetical protein
MSITLWFWRLYSWCWRKGIQCFHLLAQCVQVEFPKNIFDLTISDIMPWNKGINTSKRYSNWYICCHLSIIRCMCINNIRWVGFHWLFLLSCPFNSSLLPSICRSWFMLGIVLFVSLPLSIWLMTSSVVLKIILIGLNQYLYLPVLDGVSCRQRIALYAA